MRALLQDLRYALRQMRHALAFSISVILVLALGIGANAAIFTVLEATLFRPLRMGHQILLEMDQEQAVGLRYFRSHKC